MKMEFLELKYRLLSLLVLAESKLKSWVIKYGRRESVELLLQSYVVSLLVRREREIFTICQLIDTGILILNLNTEVPVC